MPIRVKYDRSLPVQYKLTTCVTTQWFTGVGMTWLGAGGGGGRWIKAIIADPTWRQLLMCGAAPLISLLFIGCHPSRVPTVIFQFFCPHGKPADAPPCRLIIVWYFALPPTSNFVFEPLFFTSFVKKTCIIWSGHVFGRVGGKTLKRILSSPSSVDCFEA